MKLQAIKDLSAILVHNYYQKEGKTTGTGQSGSVISEIILQLAEARDDIDLVMTVNHEKLIIESSSEPLLFQHEFKQSELPDISDQEAVKSFVELILRDYIYKV